MFSELKTRIDKQISYLRGWQWEMPLQDTGNLVKEVNYLNWLVTELYRAERLYGSDTELQQGVRGGCHRDNPSHTQERPEGVPF